MIIYDDSAIDLDTIKAYSVEHKKRYMLQLVKINTFTCYSKPVRTFHYASKIVS